MSDETKRSPERAPLYALHRAVAAADSLPETVESHGINMTDYKHAHVQVVPAGGDNPTIQVLWWSEEASKFIQEHTPFGLAGVGVNSPYEFTIECRGRIMFVAVTGGVGVGTTKVLVAGF